MEEPVVEPVAKKHNVHYGPFSALVFTLLSFFGGQLLAGIIIGFTLSVLRGQSGSQTLSWLSENLVGTALLITLAGVFSALIIGAFLKARGDDWPAIGLGKLHVSALFQAAGWFVVYIISYSGSYRRAPVFSA